MLLVRHKCGSERRTRPVDLINDASRAVMPVMLYLVDRVTGQRGKKAEF